VRVGRVKRAAFSPIPVEAANVLPSLTTSLSLSLSPSSRARDGAILIPRCGFMNKISGLSDGGVWGWRTMYRGYRGRRRAVRAGGAVPRDHAKWRCPW